MTLYRIGYYPVSNLNNVKYGNYVLDFTSAKAWIHKLNKEHTDLHHWFEMKQ